MDFKSIPDGVFVLATLAGVLTAAVAALGLYASGFLRSRAGRRAAYVINLGAFVLGYVGTVWLVAR